MEKISKNEKWSANRKRAADLSYLVPLKNLEKCFVYQHKRGYCLNRNQITVVGKDLLFSVHLRGLRRVHLDLDRGMWSNPFGFYCFCICLYFIQRREFSKVKSSTAAISVLLCYKIFLLNFLQQLYGHIWSNLYSLLAKATAGIYSFSSRDTRDTSAFLKSFRKHSHIFSIPWYKYKHISRLNRSHYEPHMQTVSHWSQNMTSLSPHLSVKTLIITAMPTFHLRSGSERKEFIGSRKYFLWGVIIAKFPH